MIPENMQDNNMSQPSMVTSSPDVAKNSITKNKLFPAVVILTILMVASTGTAVYGLVGSSAKDAEISELKAQNANDASKVDDVIVEIVENEEGNVRAGATESTTVTKSSILNEVSRNLVLKDHKCLNSNSFQITPLRSSIDDLISIRGDSLQENDSWSLQIKQRMWLILDSTQTFESIEKAKMELNGKAIDVLVAQFGNGIGYETIFFLMEDGTVEYIPLVKALKTNSLRSYGKLPGVENVIKFCNLAGNGGPEVVAQRADGDYYSLYDAIRATGNYEW